MRGIVKGGNNNGGNGATVDNIINNYVASADGAISIGDLCSFINGQVRKISYSSSTTSVNVSTLKTVSSSSYRVSAAMLDDTRAILLYSDTTYYLYGVILTISGNSITYGTPKQLTTVAAVGACVRALDSGRALFTYGNGSGGGYVYYGVLSISGTTITLNTVYSTTYNCIATAIGVLNPSKAIIAYSGNGSYTNVLPISISGTTIIAGTNTQAYGASSSYLTISVIDDTRILVGCQGSGAYGATVVTSTGDTTLTVGTPTNVLTAGSVGYVASTMLDSTHALMALTISNNIWVLVVAINESTLITLSSLQVDNNGTSSFCSVTTVDAKHAILTYTSSPLKAATIKLSDTYDISVGTIVSLGVGNASNSIAVDGTRTLLLSASSSLYVQAQVAGIDINGDVTTTFTDYPAGLALNSASSGGTVSLIHKGLAKGLSNLIPATTYYCDANGSLTTTATNVKVGVALSATELLIKKCSFTER